jgi:hypothetical protein
MHHSEVILQRPLFLRCAHLALGSFYQQLFGSWWCASTRHTDIHHPWLRGKGMVYPFVDLHPPSRLGTGPQHGQHVHGPAQSWNVYRHVHEHDNPLLARQISSAIRRQHIVSNTYGVFLFNVSCIQ